MSPNPRHRTPEETSLEKLRSKTGLAALIVTIVAVVFLAGVTAILLGGGVNSESTVAIVTAAFGIISTVATAYLGIKATANSSVEAAAASAAGSSESSDEAAVARYEEEVKKSKVDRLNEEIDKREQKGQMSREVAKELRDASVQAEEEARRHHPPKGEGKV
jgi:hypothetical protein